jgi:hypothetical protein
MSLERQGGLALPDHETDDGRYALLYRRGAGNSGKSRGAKKSAKTKDEECPPGSRSAPAACSVMG